MLRGGIIQVPLRARQGSARCQEEFPMPFCEINGFDLYYDMQGFGDAIVFLHHGFGSTKMWKAIAPRFLEHGYQTICYDRNGYGQSVGGEDFLDYYVSDAFRPDSVRDLEAFRDLLGIPAMHLVGQCEGGVVAADYAATYPHRVKTMVISSTMCFSTVDMSEFNASKFTKSFHELAPDVRTKFVSWHGERTEELFEQFRRFGGMYGKDFFDLRPVLNQVACPTLVLYPDRSFLFEVEQGVAFYRNLPKAELAVLPNCGHNTYDDQPDAYVANVLDFFSRHRFGEGSKFKMEPAGPMTCAG
jgi:pimeloyl-ACP methyl ester carboxylesterase